MDDHESIAAVFKKLAVDYKHEKVVPRPPQTDNDVFIVNSEKNPRIIASGANPTRDTLPLFINGILNRVTPDNMDAMTVLFDKCIRACNPREDIDNIAHWVVNRCIRDPHFSTVYIRLCSKQIHYETTQGFGEPTFRSSLMFVAKFHFNFDPEPCMDKLKDGLSSSPFPEEQCEHISWYTRFCHQRRKGIMNMLCDLFLRSIMRPRHIIACVLYCVERFKDKERIDDEESENNIEYACLILRRCGDKLQHMMDEETNEIMQTLEYTVDKCASRRMQCLLENVLEQQANGWRERRATEQPRRLAEVREEWSRERDGGEGDADKENVPS